MDNQFTTKSALEQLQILRIKDVKFTNYYCAKNMTKQL